MLTSAFATPWNRVMPHKFIASRRHKFSRKQYRVTNWAEHTARHSQCFLPRFKMTTSSKCHLSPTGGRIWRMGLAHCRPNFTTQNRMVSWLTMIPRSACKSTTSRKLRLKRKYSQTAYSMISGSKRWPLFCSGVPHPFRIMFNVS